MATGCRHPGEFGLAGFRELDLFKEFYFAALSRGAATTSVGPFGKIRSPVGLCWGFNNLAPQRGALRAGGRRVQASRRDAGVWGDRVPWTEVHGYLREVATRLVEWRLSSVRLIRPHNGISTLMRAKAPRSPPRRGRATLCPRCSKVWAGAEMATRMSQTITDRQGRAGTAESSVCSILETTAAHGKNFTTQ